MASPSEVAGLLLELARSHPPTLGDARLVAIDGPGGSGKTTLAAALAVLEPASRLVHMDDLYDGWHGLARVIDQVDSLVLPLAAGKVGSYRRYDWNEGRYAETVTVEPSPLLILEGVGSGSRAHAAHVTTLAWVWAPAELRLDRGIARDGSDLQAQWHSWMRDEDELHAREDTAARADIIVDGTGATPPTVRPIG